METGNGARGSLALPRSGRRVWVLICIWRDSPLSPALAFQICPSLEHASLVLLNSVLDTVPGECCPEGRNWTPFTVGAGTAGHWADR